jgi:hypothetical protein
MGLREFVGPFQGLGRQIGVLRIEQELKHLVDEGEMIDPGVPATAVVRIPERDAGSVPRPASSPGGGGLKSRTRSVLRLLRIGCRG